MDLKDHKYQTKYLLHSFDQRIPWRTADQTLSVD